LPILSELRQISKDDCIKVLTQLSDTQLLEYKKRHLEK